MLVVLLFLLVWMSPSRVSAVCSNDTEVVGHLLFKRATYNRNILPSTPVSVRIEMWIQEVSSVSELTQDFEIGTF